MGRSTEPCGLGRGTCLRETTLAVLVELDAHGEKWIPKSVLHDDSEVYSQGDDGKVVVVTWWAEANDLV